MLDAMNRATTRLVSSGFAFAHIDNEKSAKATLIFTNDGITLSRFLNRYFDTMNVRPEKLAAEDIVAFVQVILHSKPVQHPL